jgi:hypothetical protein
MNQTKHKRQFKPCQWCKSKNVRYCWNKEAGSFRKCVNCGMRALK